MPFTLDQLFKFPRLTGAGLQIIRDPVRTFADENQVRDTVLAPSEVRVVRDAAHKLGVKIGYTPTGRYAEILLHECMERAYHNAAAAHERGDRFRAEQWRAVAARAKRAISQVPRQEAS